MSRDILRLAIGFDSAVISVSSVLVHVALIHERVINYKVATKLLPSIDLIILATRGILQVIGDWSVTVVDAWILPKKVKICVLLGFILVATFLYLNIFLAVEQKRDMLLWRVYHHEVGVLGYIEKPNRLCNEVVTALLQRAFV